MTPEQATANRAEIKKVLEYANKYTELADYECLGDHIYDPQQAIALSYLALVHYMKAAALFAIKALEDETL